MAYRETNEFNFSETRSKRPVQAKIQRMLFGFYFQLNYTSFAVFCQLKISKAKKEGVDVRLNRLRKRREEMGMTQAELGMKVGLSPVTVCQIEKGLKDTSGERWKIIASALECTTDELLGVLE